MKQHVTKLNAEWVPERGINSPSIWLCSHLSPRRHLFHPWEVETALSTWWAHLPIKSTRLAGSSPMHSSSLPPTFTPHKDDAWLAPCLVHCFTPSGCC